MLNLWKSKEWITLLILPRELRLVLLKQVSFSEYLEAVKRIFRRTWTQWRNGISGHSPFNIHATPIEVSFYLGVSQVVTTFAARAKTEHIITQAYLNIYNLANFSLCQACGKEGETDEHILLQCDFQIIAHDSLVKEQKELIINDILRNKKFWSFSELGYKRHKLWKSHLKR